MTTGQLVGFESGLERDHLVLMDFAAVAQIASQPFWPYWRGDSRERRHARGFELLRT
ncbi:hypothetical protein OG372_04095 [Streptomyces sp. NBC_01020]|uniref:hypothetical protein n=1 Tax=Streptomyces sp. NBC_01020 TaxID=2903722 RepID=UPI003863FC56|nr:hypothetical protein OG372_04095 [Streptomyces sp. NBC_01020]